MNRLSLLFMDRQDTASIAITHHAIVEASSSSPLRFPIRPPTPTLSAVRFGPDDSWGKPPSVCRAIRREITVRFRGKAGSLLAEESTIRADSVPRLLPLSSPFLSGVTVLR